MGSVDFIILLISLVMAGILSAYLWYYKRQIKELKEQLEFIKSEDTNYLLTSKVHPKEMEQMIIEINQILKKHRELEITLRRTNRNFRESITSISHDIRTPLTSAKGYIQMLRTGNLKEDKGEEYLIIIEKRINSVQNLLNQLFEYTRIESGEYTFEIEQVNLNNVLMDTLSVFYNEFLERGDEPKVSICEQPCFIKADKNAIERIFSNLIYNGLIHGTGNYKIELEKEDNIITFSCSNHTDSIEEEDIERIFERFYTTDKSRTKKSTGLGLAITKRFTEAMGGQIEASMREGLFEVRIKFLCEYNNNLSKN